MDFNFTTEQLAIRDLAQQFASEQMAPHAAKWDAEHIFPIATLRQAAELGFAGIYVNEAHGGSGLSRLDAAIIFEQLASGCVSTAAYLSIHNMVNWIIANYATTDLQQTWLEKLCRLDIFSSYCLTEPNAGSDAASLQTKAELQNDNYILDGTKAFISGGSQSDLYIVMARTGETGPKGISCFLVEKTSPGISFGKLEEKLGWNSQPTTMVFMENCQIPASNLIGELGNGFNVALQALNGGRINIAACSLGGAQACLDLAKQHLHERKQFGKSLAEFQALQFKFADLYTELEAARLLVYRAAAALDQNDSQAPLHCATAKRFATDVGFKVSDQVMQLFGGYGYLRDYPVERYFRDLRVHQILEGTNEIMRLIIARNLLTDN